MITFEINKKKNRLDFCLDFIAKYFRKKKKAHFSKTVILRKIELWKKFIWFAIPIFFLYFGKRSYRDYFLDGAIENSTLSDINCYYNAIVINLCIFMEKI